MGHKTKVIEFTDGNMAGVKAYVTYEEKDYITDGCEIISAPAVCLSCGTRHTAPTTGQLMNQCSLCCGTLVPEAMTPAQKEILKIASTLQVRLGGMRVVSEHSLA